MAIQHIVVLTFPTHGHINPLISFARLMIPHGLTFTFAVLESSAQKLRHDIEQLESSSSSCISIAPLESSCSLSGNTSENDPYNMMRVFEVCNGTRPSFEKLLRDLAADEASGISCIITDPFLSWSTEVASLFKLPIFSFFTSNAHTLSVVVHSESILSKIASVQDISDEPCNDQDLDQPMDLIPGARPLCLRDLPDIRGKAQYLTGLLVKHVLEVSGVILNTVYEIESSILCHIKRQTPVYTIGPLMLMLKSIESAPKQVTHAQNNLTKDSSCLKWLNSKPSSSVIYISFGSLAKMDNNKMKQLAQGIEDSKQSFLWVIRTNMIDDMLPNILPEGFLDRTKERGLIIEWAPQVQVLSHKAIGCFLTHCGWNSLTENLSLGAVPIICWPQMAEQRMNARIAVNEWRIGLELEEENGVVKAEEIERKVIKIMEGTTGKELKSRAVELKQKLLSAVEEGGTSRNSLLDLCNQIKKAALKPIL